MSEQRVLEGVRIIDFGRALAAPMCTLLLADLGADVIKVEAPGAGDDSRAWPPHINDESTYFLSVNRNKRSVVLDLSTEEGRGIARLLISKADIVVENFRPGVMGEWGLGYDDLKNEFPELIYCSISGFGDVGPRSSLPATDIAMQAYGGVMSITGEPGRLPPRIGVSLTDITAGMLASYGILAALLARRESGKGQRVSTSLLDGQMAMLSYHIAAFAATGHNPGPIGTAHPSLAPYTIFRTRDGMISLAAFNDRLFQRAVRAMGLEELLDDSRYATNPLRVEHREQLEVPLSQRFLEENTAHWFTVLSEANVPVAPVNTLADLAVDPQVIAGEMWQTLEHPVAGEFTTFGFPVRMSENPAAVHRPPPVLGQHTREVLSAAGLPICEVERLESVGIVFSSISETPRTVKDKNVPRESAAPPQGNTNDE